MRLTVIGALRAATMATKIQSTCFSEGQACVVNRAASNAPVSAKGSAKTECSNLIISRTVRRRVIEGVGMWILTQSTQSSRRRGIRADTELAGHAHALASFAAAEPVQRNIASCGKSICESTRQTYCVTRSLIVFGA